MQRGPSTIHLAAALSILLPMQAWAQRTPPANAFNCGTAITGQPLAIVPEIQATDGMLRGTLYTVSEQQRMTTPSNGIGSDPYCFPQWVRAYRRSAPANWNPTSQQLTNPMPGPTLRARVGDIVALTFMNVIDPTKFPGTDDSRCDETGPGGNIYPGKGRVSDPDEYPDCFAGSVYTNVHFHGTHTNPNSTGDNVFLQIRPSPRKTDGTNVPVITAESVRPAFAEFYNACQQQLKSATGPKMWPRTWSDLPSVLQTTLMDPLKQYAPEWWTINQKLIANGNFPQYYAAAFPYCFKLPELKNAPASTDTTAVTDTHAAHTPGTRGAGEAEIDEAKAPSRPLLMGQAPGTHWYHAHKHGSTTINVMNGMTGAFIIEGEYDDALNTYYGAGWTRKQPVLVIQQLGGAPGLLTNAGGGPGPDFSVNGQLRPVISMPGNSTQMWRIANTAGRAGIYFDEPAGIRWKQIAQDGVQYSKVNYADPENLDRAFLLASGNRADLLVQAPAFNAAAGADNTYEVQVFNTIDEADRPPRKPNVAPVTLLTVQVTANEEPPSLGFMPAAPPFPDFLKDIKDEEISGTKVITFASSALGAPGGPVTGAKYPSQQTIDGKKFDGELGVVVALNRAEEWKIVNETYPPGNSNWISHPFHIHINPFQISEIFDPNAVLSTAKGDGTVSLAKIVPVTTPTKPPEGNQSTITGVGTDFERDFKPGSWIWIESTPKDPANMAPSMVSRVVSKTELIIDNAPGAGRPAILPGATYRTVVPLYTIDRAKARPDQCVLDPNDPQTWKPCKPTVPATDRIWWDVFSIPSGSTFADAAGTVYNIPGYFKMRSRFVDYSGYYVIHCHILAHEDRGMMTVVEVAPLQTPYSHH